MTLNKIFIPLSAAALVLAGNVTASVEPYDEASAMLDYDEQETLLFMREEEKLARDVYHTLYDVWGNPVFAAIEESEKRHTEAIQDQLEKYGLEDPVVDDSTGAFYNTDLQEKYYLLVDKGQQSELEALMVGAYIEELDMIDLLEAIEETDEVSLDRTYGNLLRGSRNHLRAFVSRIEELTGEIYKAQLLDQDSVDAIVSQPVETGRS